MTRILVHSLDKLVAGEEVRTHRERGIGAELNQLCCEHPTLCLVPMGIRRTGWKIASRDFDVRLTPTSVSTLDLEVHFAPRALHGPVTETWARASELSRQISFRMDPTHEPTTGLGVRQVDLHADVGAWRFGPETYRRFSRTGRARWLAQEEEGQFLGGSFGTQMRIYKKSEEIKKYARKAYISESWGGETGAVWRVETRHRFKRPNRRFPNLTDSWQATLAAYSLRRRRGGQRDRRVGRWPIDPVWRELLSLVFYPPWGGQCSEVVMPPLDHTKTIKTEGRRVLTGLAKIAALTDEPFKDPVPAACTILGRLADGPEGEEHLRGRYKRARAIFCGSD